MMTMNLEMFMFYTSFFMLADIFIERLSSLTVLN